MDATLTWTDPRRSNQANFDGMILCGLAYGAYTEALSHSTPSGNLIWINFYRSHDNALYPSNPGYASSP